MLPSLCRRFTYANVMATIAVFIALGGSSYAVAAGSIGSRQLKNNAVRSSDLKNNDIRGRDLRNGTLAGIDVKNDALTGVDVRESTLATVPSANRADVADSARRADRANLATDVAAPERFHEVGAPGEPPFNAGCANTPGLPSLAFYKDREGVVHLKGSYTCTKVAAPAFNLPRGYRPPSGAINAQAIACFGGLECDSLTTAVDIVGAGVIPGADGGVLAGATEVSLDGVEFRGAD
jgi:hypothetical protein